MNTDLLKSFGFGAVIAAVLACWNQVKSVLASVRSLVIQKVEFDSFTSYHISNFLFKNGKVVNYGNKVYHSFWSYIKPLDTELNVVFKTPRHSFLIYNKAIIFASDNLKSLMFLRGTLNIEQLIKDSLDFDYYTEATAGKRNFYKYHYSGMGAARYSKNQKNVDEIKSANDKMPSIGSDDSNYTDYGKFLPLVKWDKNDLIKPEIEKEKLYYTDSMIRVRREIENWINNKKWFKERGLRHFGSALLSSKPGAGKSSLIEDICVKLKLPLLTFDLSSYDNKEFIAEWKQIDNSSVILFEDFDSQWNGRNHLFDNKEIDHLTFDCLLNCISGPHQRDGIFLIITANHPGKIDEALKRPGRLNLHIELEPLPKEGRLFIANKILKDWPELIDKLVEENKGKTAAEFENLAIELATSKFWQEKSK